MTGGENGDALLTLYEALKASKKITTRDLPADERRAYLRELKRRSRERAKASAEAGRIEDRADVVRDVLADAAIILLASDGPGADEIERLLRIAFRGRPGVPGKVRARARATSLRPKILTPEVLRAGIGEA